jgi:hypothetical protein
VTRKGEWQMLRAMSNEGVSISEMARRVGLDRKTVRRVLRSESWPDDDARVSKIPGQSGRVKRPSKLDPFKGYIEARLEKAPLSLTIPSLPRMADFARWGCAISVALGHRPDEFLAAYERNASARNDEILHSHPVAAAVVLFMDGMQQWTGTPTELLRNLEGTAQMHRLDTQSKVWPRAANALTRRLNEVRPNLAAQDIQVAHPPKGCQRTIRLYKADQNTVGIVGTVDASATAKDPAPPGPASFDDFWRPVRGSLGGGAASEENSAGSDDTDSISGDVPPWDSVEEREGDGDPQE